jgi:hypothetical protein
VEFVQYRMYKKSGVCLFLFLLLTPVVVAQSNIADDIIRITRDTVSTLLAIVGPIFEHYLEIMWEV